MPKITFACRQPLTELVSSGGLWDTTLTEEVTTFWSIDLNNMEIWGRASSTKSICSQPPSECNRNINHKSRSQHTVDGISIYTKAVVWGRATSQACGWQGGLRTAWGSHLSTCPSRLWQRNLPGLPVSLQDSFLPGLCRPLAALRVHSRQLSPPALLRAPSSVLSPNCIAPLVFLLLKLILRAPVLLWG